MNFSMVTQFLTSKGFAILQQDYSRITAKWPNYQQNNFPSIEIRDVNGSLQFFSTMFTATIAMFNKTEFMEFVNYSNTGSSVISFMSNDDALVAYGYIVNFSHIGQLELIFTLWEQDLKKLANSLEAKKFLVSFQN